MEWSTPNFSFRLINGLTGDPGLLFQSMRTGEAVLFDLGSLEQLPPKDILKVRRVFISHTHIDHFIGFERLLRLNIPHKRSLEFCGPPGLANNVQGKLHGYLWNLLDPGQIQMLVREISPEGQVQSFKLTSDDQFALHPADNIGPMAGPQVRPLPVAPAAFLTNLDDLSRIEAVCLDHGTPSVSYVCQANLRFQVKQHELEALNLKPGPWIRELQTLTANGAYDDAITVGNKTWSVGDLSAEVLTYHAPRPVGYLTDLLFSWENLHRLKSLMQDVECLVCESNFAEADFAKAFAKKHLTTKQAALIAAYVGAESLQVFHISNLYRDNIAPIADEAQQYFQTFQPLAQDAIVDAIEKEIARLK